MKQSRRVSPRIPYDEAICLNRVDGAGRHHVQACDLGVSGMLAMSGESCPVGADVKFSLLLPGGPRRVGGKIVRVTPNPTGYSLAIAFLAIEASTSAAIERLIAEHTRDDEAHGGDAGPVTAKLGLAPALSGDPPRPAGDPAPVSEAPATSRGAVDAIEEWAPPPAKRPPPGGEALPVVLVSRGRAPDRRRAEERPPRRHARNTAEVARRPLAAWAFAPTTPVAEHARPTARVELLDRGWRHSLASGSWSYLLMIVPAALAIAALLRAI